MAIINLLSVNQHKARVEAIMKAHFPEGSFLRRSVLGMLRDTIAGAAYLLQTYTEQSAKLAHPATTTGAELEGMADVWGLARKDITTARATITATIAGEAGNNASINMPEGEEVIINGTTYTAAHGLVDNLGAITEDTEASVELIEFTASDSGVLSAVAVGSEASFVRNISEFSTNVRSITLSVAGFINGSDVENDSELRSRLQSNIRAPFSGGTDADWERWTLQVAGVTRAFVSSSFGYVIIAFVYDNRANIIPTAAEREAMEEHLEQFRPATSVIKIIEPTEQAIDITIADLTLENESQSVESAKILINSALLELFSDRSFIGNNARVFPLAWLYAAVETAVPGARFNITTPAADVVVDNSAIPVRGAVSYE